MDIEGIGESLAGALLNAGLVADAGDLYSLTEEQLAELTLEGDKQARKLGEATARKISDELAASKERPLSRLIFALGIRHVGSEIADILAESYPSIDALAAATDEELQAIAGIGPKIAESVHAYLEDAENRRLIEKLRRAGVRLAEEGAARAEGPLRGITFVITGALAAFTREEAEERVRELGGSAGSSVTRKTDYVVVGENPGSKLRKAREYETKTLSEAEFLELLHRNGAI